MLCRAVSAGMIVPTVVVMVIAMMVVVVLMMVGLGGNIGSRAGDNEDSVGDGGDDADADDSRNGKGDAINSDDRRSDCGSSSGSHDSGDGNEDGRKGGYPFGDGNGDGGKDRRFSFTLNHFYSIREYRKLKDACRLQCQLRGS